MRQIIKNEIKLSAKLRTLLEDLGIKNLRITGLGNAANIGVNNLVVRDGILTEIMKNKEIEVQTAYFYSLKSNYDQYISKWFFNNIPLTYVESMNENILFNSKVTQQDVERGYGQTDSENNIRMCDFIYATDNDLANIVIYDAVKGSFLNYLGKSIYNLKENITSTRAVLDCIQENNRENGAKTQVYICGLPNYKAIKANEFINARLRKLSKEFANVTYVEPVTTNLLSKEDHSITLDPYYTDAQHAEFSNHILESIVNNYLIVDAMIKIDRDLCELNQDIAASVIESNSEVIDEAIDYIVRMNITAYKTLNKIELRKRLKQYISRKLENDYYCIGKDKIEASRLLTPGYQKKISR